VKRVPSGADASYQAVFSTLPGSQWVIPAELLTAGLLGLLLVVLIVRMRGVPWLAWPGLGLGLLAALELGLRLGKNSNDVTGYIVIGLALLLATALLVFIPRLIVWWGCEAWWISLGSAVVIALVLALGLLVMNAATNALGLPYEVGYWSAYVLPFVSLGLTVWGLLRPAERRCLPLPEPGPASGATLGA
jgi:hypothetical protein